MVSKARRQTVFEKQGATLTKLQQSLETTPASTDIDRILQNHSIEMENFQKNLKLRREIAEKKTNEKRAAIKSQKEQEMKSKLGKIVPTELTEQQKRGVGNASKALLSVLLEQRHNKAMEKLNTETFAELEKYKRDLHLKLEQDLQEELKVQEKELLTQLALASGMSKEDLQVALSAVNEDNTDNKDAQKPE